MQHTYPEWKPEEHRRYEEVMADKCAVEMSTLAESGKAALVAYMLDPIAVHRRLYADLVPDGYSEYAGTCRGTPDSSLLTRQSHVRRSSGAVEALTPPERVGPALASFCKFVEVIEKAPDDEAPSTSLMRAVRLFNFFGGIHPFLDGNGHVQRLLFAAAVRRFPRLSLNETWTIHPRPYDVNLRDAFEARGPGQPYKALFAALLPFVEFDTPKPVVSESDDARKA